MEKAEKVVKHLTRLAILPNTRQQPLFGRLRLLPGVQPQYRVHVHEYTKNEVEELLAANGFEIIRSYYSAINDLTYVDVREPRQHLSPPSYPNLAKHALANPTRTNAARLLAYPLVKLVPSLRQLIVIVAEKVGEPETTPIERW
ncbi:hypothetical protein WLZ34_03885 [Thermogladius sp. KZ2Tp1]|uniref:hypothetical protein n=1 Tax=Thermogladius sp. KZ2Tp1 TaxID=3136289 RepID=UPI003DA85712